MALTVPTVKDVYEFDQRSQIGIREVFRGEKNQV